MRKKINLNALSVAIILFIVVILVCNVIFTLYHQFGAFNSEKHNNTEFTIKFTVKDTKGFTFEEDTELYLFDSREYLGAVQVVSYNSENEMIVTVISKGFNKDDQFFLNGKTMLTQGNEIYVTNKKIPVKIEYIY